VDGSSEVQSAKYKVQSEAERHTLLQREPFKPRARKRRGFFRVEPMQAGHLPAPRTLTALTAAWLVCLTTPAVAQSAASIDRFELAIVRHDSAIVPFAAYDRGVWTKAWPDANESSATKYDALDDVPNFWRTRGVPVPDRWRIWPLRGSRPLDARVTGLTAVRAHCIAQVAALATDAPRLPLDAEVAPVRLQGVAVQGVAVHGAAAVRPIVKVDRLSAVWAGARRAVLAEFDRLERNETVRRSSVPSINERPSPVARLVSVHRAQTASSSALYFVAEKSYRTPRYPGDRRCPGETKLTGWLLPAANRTLRVAAPRLFLTTCGETDVAILDPLGFIAVAPDRMFWIARELYYEGEAYVVFSAGPDDVSRLITAYGGGC
jgi:hypothetical protein